MEALPPLTEEFQLEQWLQQFRQENCQPDPFDSLQVLGSDYPLTDLVRRGLEIVAERQDKRQELYVLTVSTHRSE